MLPSMARVFVTGATGYLGRAIAGALRARGDDVVALTRDPERARDLAAAGATVVAGDPTVAGPWQDHVAGCDAVINLAGEPIDARRWNAQFRQRLLDSRVDATRFVVDAIAAAPTGQRPRVLVSASGIDYYAFSIDLPGDDANGGDDVFDEASPRGDGFMARMCRDWEEEALRAGTVGCRVVCMRTGIVIGPGSRALAKMARPFRWFVGGRVGSGRQWLSWVHLDDAVGAYLFAVDTPALAGPVNLVSRPVRQAAFARALGRALRRPCWLPVPAGAVKLAVGPLAEYVLRGRAAVPAKLEAAGYALIWTDVDAAVAASLGRPVRASGE